MNDIVPALLAGWLGCLAGGLLLWLWSLRSRDAGVADVGWGLFFVALTAWAHGRAAEPGGPQRLHLLLVAIWGLRLAAHIAWRRRGHGEDPRYAAMRRQHGARFGWRSLTTVFALQATLAAALSAPLLAVQSAAAVAPALFALGVGLWVIGFLFEAVADWQLRRFRAAPENRGRVLDGGLWRYSRHPNYFGEAVLWWGYGAMAAAAGAWWTLAAPLVMTWLLLRVSGVALLEKTIGGRRPEYARYVRRTSAFLPRPPRRLDP